jgi:hypothetical protein
MAAQLFVDVCLSDVAAPIDIPGMQYQAGAPTPNRVMHPLEP